MSKFDNASEHFCKKSAALYIKLSINTNKKSLLKIVIVLKNES
jgi:hypothetical protein